MSGGVGLGAALEVGQLERTPIVGRAGHRRAGGCRRQLGQGCLLVVEPGVGARVGVGFDLGGEHFAATTGAAVVIGDRVAGDAEHPGGDPFVVVERAEVLVDAQHHLGDDVVGLVRIVDPAADEALRSTRRPRPRSWSRSSARSVLRSSVIVIPMVMQTLAGGDGRNIPRKASHPRAVRLNQHHSMIPRRRTP